MVLIVKSSVNERLKVIKKTRHEKILKFSISSDLSFNLNVPFV